MDRKTFIGSVCVCVWGGGGGGDVKGLPKEEKVLKVTVSGKRVHLAFEVKKGNDVLD